MFERLISFWDKTTLYLNRSVFYAIFGAAVLFMVSYIVPVFFTLAIVVLVFTAISVLVDFYLLYRNRNGIEAARNCAERLSNGDENRILIEFKNNYDHKITCTVIDELPYQLQERNWHRKMQL